MVAGDLRAHDSTGGVALGARWLWVIPTGHPGALVVRYCFTDFDLQTAEYTRALENFWCPLCRFRRANGTVLGAWGMGATVVTTGIIRWMG